MHTSELPEPVLAVDIESAERSRNLDILRAFAALSVLATHAYGFNAARGSEFNLGFAERSLIGSSGVWLFFALSGYLITGPFIRSLMRGSPLPGLREYATRRGARIFPAYLVAFAAVVLFGLPRSPAAEWWQFPVHAGLLHNLVPGEEQAMYYASWTLTLELLFYACVPVIAYLLRRARPGPITARELSIGVLILWSASVFWTFAAGSIDGNPETALWLRFLLPSMLSMFCPGILAAIAVVEWREHGRPPRWFEWISTHRALTLAAIAALYGLGVLGIFQLLDTQLYDFSRQAFAIGFGLVVVLALTRRDLGGRPGQVFAWLGLISYGLYLWHTAIRQIIVRQGVDKLMPMPQTGGVVALFVHIAYLFVLTLPLAWLSWVLVERPAMRWAKRDIETRHTHTALVDA